jgi:two-component system, OmpR family, response regulator
MNVCAISSIPASRQDQVQSTILCADGSPEILEICETILNAEGYQVLTVSSGAAVLDSLKLHPIAAVVIDDTMPDMSALDLAREIKRSAENVIVVMYCGTLHEEERFPFVDSSLSKGKGPVALRKLLGSLLQR